MSAPPVEVTSPPPPSKRPKRTGQPSSQKWWYTGLAIGIGILGGMVLISSDWQSESVSYPDFLALIGSEKPSEPSSVTVEHVDLFARKTPVRLSEPQSLKIHDGKITGTLLRDPFSPDGTTDPTAAERVNFETVLHKSDGSVDDLVRRLEGARFTDWEFVTASSWWSNLGSFLLAALLVGGLFMMLSRGGHGIGGALGFAKHRGRMYVVDHDPIKFSAAAGIDEAVEEVREVVDFLTQPEKYQKLGGRIPKGVLLVGPPGTGKTLLARAIAGEAGVPFISMSGSDFVEMYAGVGAARVRDVFEQARGQAPCIIFIDELDALGKSRTDSSSGSGEEREQTLNALLVEMDGFDGRTGVIMIAATNRPEILDPALLRPGRFDRQVVVGRPDLRGRDAILRVHADEIRLGADVDLQEIASLTPGFVGADLANLVNEAALLAARRDRTSVTAADFHEGIERLIAGLEKKQRHMDEAIKRRVAGHEAGHAIIASCLPHTPPVHKVSIIPRGMGAGGFTMQKPGGDRYLQTRMELDSTIQVLLGGTLAEELLFGDISTGASNDLERATQIAAAMVTEYGMSRLGRVSYAEPGGSPFLATGGHPQSARTMSGRTAREVDIEVRRILTEATEQARAILLERQAALLALTERLIEVETVSGAELDALLLCWPTDASRLSSRLPASPATNISYHPRAETAIAPPAES